MPRANISSYVAGIADDQPAMGLHPIEHFGWRAGTPHRYVRKWLGGNRACDKPPGLVVAKRAAYSHQ
jgi:hypothetical protein